MLSRAGMFRVSEGVGVDMKDRVYELHSFHSKFHLLFILDIILLFLAKLIIYQSFFYHFTFCNLCFRVEAILISHAVNPLAMYSLCQLNMQLTYSFHLQSYGYSKLSKVLKPGLVTFYIFWLLMI